MPPDPHDLGNRHRLLQPELTGFRLLTIALTTTFGVSKAVLAYYGHSVVPATLELVFGVIVGIALFWLGVYEDEAPGAVPWLFQTDYRRPLTRAFKKLMFLAFIAADVALMILLLRSLPSLLRAAQRRNKDPHVALDIVVHICRLAVVVVVLVGVCAGCVVVLIPLGITAFFMMLN